MQPSFLHTSTSFSFCPSPHTSAPSSFCPSLHTSASFTFCPSLHTYPWMVVDRHWTKLHSFTFSPVLYRRERVWGTLFPPLCMYWEQTVWAHSFPPVYIQGGKSVAYTLFPPVYIQTVANSVIGLFLHKRKSTGTGGTKGVP